MTKWYIDALDPRAGFAVATQRDSDLLPEEIKLSGSSAFIAPPNFQGEILGTRSTGFAMTRYRAQIGLFHNGQEISFDSLPAVTEFVRRTYLSGGGGDGPGENGDVAPPKSPGKGGEEPGKGKEDHNMPPPPESGSGIYDPVQKLRMVATDNRFKSYNLKLGQSEEAAKFELPTSVGQAARLRLIRGGWRLIRELWRREPGPGMPSTIDTLAVSANVAIAAHRMGIWQEIRQTPWIEGKNNKWDWDWFIFHWGKLHDGSDKFDELAAVPVPSNVLPSAAAVPTNLQGLLSAALAVPSTFLESAECAELVLFGAAYLNLYGEFSPYFSDDGRIQEELTNRLMDRTLRWLRENLPKRIYAKPVEELIQQAPTIQT